MREKVVERNLGSKNRVSIYCSVCGKITRERKLYCPEHIETLPRVQELLWELEVLLDEKDGFAPPNLLIACMKALLIDNFGSASHARLGKYLGGIDQSIVIETSDILIERGEAERFSTKRSDFIRLF